jgi:predicted metal-dependent hydrolase
MWGNNEGGHCDDAFESAWKEKEEKEDHKRFVRGYD